MLAYAVEIATFLVDTFGGGQGDWDPVRNVQVSAANFVDSDVPSTCFLAGQQRRVGTIDHLFLCS